MYQYQSWTSLSDHSMVIVHQKVMVDRGPGQWCFPDDVLEDDKLTTRISQLLQKDLGTDSICMHWEMLKLEIRDLIQEFTKFHKKQKHSELLSLQRLL